MKYNSEADIFFLGDTYFGEWHMRLRARRGQYNVLKKKGYLHFGRNFETFLKDADEVVLNLECAITDIDKSPLANTDKVHLYKAEEVGTISALRRLGVTTVMMANNHSVDYGKAGLIDTIESLSNAGIKYIGGGVSEEDAMRPLIFDKDVNGSPFKAAVVSTYNYGRKSEDYGFYAKGNIPGVNCQNLRKIKGQISQLKREFNGIYYILSPHWGPNYVWRTVTQQKQADELIDVGVDLIVGHSAHMIQEVEYRRGKLVVYSIGNFLLNGNGEYEARNLPPYSFIARLNVRQVEKRLVGRLMLYPILCDNLATDFTTRFVNNDEFSHVVSIVRGLSFCPASFDRSVIIGNDKFGNYLSYSII